MAKLIVHNPPTVKLKASGYTGTPTGDIELTENNRTYNVSSFATATTAIPEEEKTVTPSTAEQVVIPDNGLLKKVTVNPTLLEEKTVTPTTEQQPIIPQSPAIGFSQVTVEPVTPSIDPDIQPQNIKQGVDILGVQGTLRPPTLITKQITENGTYTAADDNADGYSEVTVNVPSGGEFIHTRDIVLDEDVAEIAIEFSKNTIAAYLVCNLSIISESGADEWIYPHYQGKAKSDYLDSSLNFTGVGSFAIANDSTFFSLSRTTKVYVKKRNASAIDTQATHRKILLALYYANSVFATGGNIQIYECFGKGT